MTVSKTMRAASPPASAAELIEATNPCRRARNKLGRMNKQNSLDDMGLDLDDGDDLDEVDSGIQSNFGRDSPRYVLNSVKGKITCQKVTMVLTVSNNLF